MKIGTVIFFQENFYKVTSIDKSGVWCYIYRHQTPEYLPKVAVTNKWIKANPEFIYPQTEYPEYYL